MPRYNLNQDDVNIIIEALNKKADSTWNPQEQNRVRRLILRLQGKIDARGSNANTAPMTKQEDNNNEHPVVYDDSLWNFYHKKDN